MDTTKMQRDQIPCLLIVIECSTFPWQATKEELAQLLQKQADEELVSKFLDAGECFVAAKELEGKFFGPAILLYVAAIEIFIDGPDIERQKQIDEAKCLFKKEGLWGDNNVKETVKAAKERTRFERINRFLKAELKAGLGQANYPGVHDDIAKRVVGVTNDVRHRGQIKGKAYFCPALFVSGGKIIRPEREQLEGKGHRRVTKKLKQVMGPKIPGGLEITRLCRISNGPIQEIFPFPMTVKPFEELIEPARLASANAITKRLEELQIEELQNIGEGATSH